MAKTEKEHGNWIMTRAKGPFRSLNQATTCYYQSNHSKVE